MVVELEHKNYEHIQSEYDQLYKETPVRDEDRAYQWFAKQLLKYQPHLNAVLDVACGGGYFLREIKRIHPKIQKLVGSDISPEAIKLAEKECPEATYSVSVAEKMPFENAEFDAITCLGSLEHFLNIGDAVKEMKRVSKPNGLFFILVPNIIWYKDILSVLFTQTRKTRNQTHERFASLGEWIEMLESLGLRVEKSIKYNGIAKRPLKQWVKDLVIPRRFSYHFLFLCRNQ